jgi:hypothetical protein
MQITLNIPDELAAEAEAKGVALDSFILTKLSASRRDTAVGQRTVDEAIHSIRELRKGNRLGGMSTRDLVEEGRRH